jgi:hypothetical protein
VVCGILIKDGAGGNAHAAAAGGGGACCGTRTAHQSAPGALRWWRTLRAAPAHLTHMPVASFCSSAPLRARRALSGSGIAQQRSAANISALYLFSFQTSAAWHREASTAKRRIRRWL